MIDSPVHNLQYRERNRSLYRAIVEKESNAKFLSQKSAESACNARFDRNKKIYTFFETEEKGRTIAPLERHHHKSQVVVWLRRSYSRVRQWREWRMYQNQARGCFMDGNARKYALLLLLLGCGTAWEKLAGIGSPIEKGPRNSFHGMLIKDRTGQIETRAARYSLLPLLRLHCFADPRLLRRTSCKGSAAQRKSKN